jgi:hypothetical protein
LFIIDSICACKYKPVFFVCQVDSGKPLVKVEGEEGAQGSGEPGEAMEVKITFPDQLEKR